MRPARPSPACSSRARPPHSRPIPPASSTTRSRKGCAGSRRSGRRRGGCASKPSSAACRCRPARTSVRSSPRPIATRRSGGRPPMTTTSSARKRNHAAFGFGPHFCSGHHFSRVQMRIAIQRLFERLPNLRPTSTDHPCSTAGSSGRRSICTCGGTPDPGGRPRAGRSRRRRAADLTAEGLSLVIARAGDAASPSRPGARTPSARSPTAGSKARRCAARATARCSR